MHDLQVQLNNAMRTVSGVKLEDRVEVSDLLLQVGIPSVNQLAAETTLLETWRQINLGFPTGDCFVFRNEHTVLGPVVVNFLGQTPPFHGFREERDVSRVK